MLAVSWSQVPAGRMAKFPNSNVLFAIAKCRVSGFTCPHAGCCHAASMTNYFFVDTKM